MAGSPMSNDDFVMHLLQGIPLEYDLVIANINSLPTSLGAEYALALLLSQEIRLKTMTDEPDPVVHAAETTRKFDNSNMSRPPTESICTYTSRGNNNFCGKGRNRGRSSGSRYFYQVCT